MTPRVVIFGTGIACSLGAAAFVAGAVVGTAIMIGVAYGKNS